MATFTESFNKADGSLGPDLTWTPLQSAPQIWEVTGNQASPRGATRGLVEYARAEHDMAGSDMYAQVVVTALSAGSQGGPCVRFDPAAATFYGVEVFGNGDISIQRVVAGARTPIGSGTVTITLPATLRLEVSGDSLTAFWAGVQCATATDANIAGGIRSGIMGFEETGAGLGLTVDSFETGDLVGAVPAEGAGGFGLGLALAGAGARQSAGSATAGLGLGLAAAGSRPSQGAATFSLGLSLAATGLTMQVDSASGQASAGLGLHLAATGARPSQGAAAFTFGLGLAASTVIVAPTPPERTYTVPAESRTLVVPAESRTLTIPAEVRHVHVPA